jgi:DNA modification methylase
MIDLNEKPLCTIPRVMCWACDNIDLLESQPDESVDLIYSDILYGTGKNFGEYQDLKPKQYLIDSHYIPRLIEMKRVLKQNGSIYLQMDTRINHWMRILMDKVFGYDNFQNEIVWCYKSGGGTKNNFGKKHDVILFYSKSKNFKFNAYKEKSYGTGGGGQGGKVKYYKDDKGTYNFVGLNDWFNLSMLATTHSERNGYPTQKPKDLIKRFVLASSNEGDTVADYYLGSGTTAEVCKELNRNFIGCDINPNAIELTKTRLNAGT